MRFVLFVVLSVFCVFCSGQSARVNMPESARLIKNPYGKDESKIKPGLWLYQKYCWVCHGDNGLGNGPMSGDIKIPPANFNNPDVVKKTDGELYWWVTNGGEEMQPYKDVLTDEERWMLINYIRKVQNKL